MKRLLALLAVLLAGAVAAPSWSAPNLMGGPTGVLMRDYTVILDGTTSDSPGFETVGACSIKLMKVGTGSVSVYAVSTRNTATSSGTLIATLTTDGQRVSVTPPTRWARAVASGTGLDGSILHVECPALSASGGGNVDADGNGLYESAYIFDADRDGSTYVTCTAKDTPDSACKVAGEVIYRDAADDLTCMIHGCGSIAASMEHGGVIFLRAGVYMNFPCWRPGGTNDPTDPSTRNSTGDAAYSDCPIGEESIPVTQFSLSGWGGEIVGAGLAQERTDTTALAARGYGRTDATYIVDDRGNREDPYFFAVPNLRKTFAFGYANQAAGVRGYGRGSFTGTGGGWGAVMAITGTSDEIEDNGTAILCVCDTTAGSCTISDDDATTGGVTFDIQNVTTATQLLLDADVSQTTDGRSAISVVSPRSNPPYVQGICDDANTVAVPVGVSMSGQTAQGALPAMLEEFFDNTGFLYVLRDDYFASNARISNVTFEPQDWWNEPGGDCADTGVIAAGGTSTDADCDTDTMVTIHGYNGKPALQNVSVRYWHDFSVDGESVLTHAVPNLDQVLFQYGNGAAFSDPGHGWRYRSITIRDSVFSGSVFANFGNGQVMEDLLIQNSSFDNVIAFSNQKKHYWKQIRIESSEFQTAFSIACGVTHLRLDDVYATGRLDHNTQGPTQMLGLVSMECDTETKPTTDIWLTNLREDPPGSNFRWGGAYSNGGSQVLVEVRISDTDETGNIQRVFLQNSSIYNDRVSSAGSGFTSREEGCLVAIQDRTAAGGAGTDGLLGSDGTGGSGGELDTLRQFHLIGNTVRGQLFCEFSNSGYYDDIPATSDSALFDAHRDLAETRNVVY